jgi:hypothetical protein
MCGLFIGQKRYKEPTGRSMALPEQQRFGNIAVLQYGVLRNIVAKILTKI